MNSKSLVTITESAKGRIFGLMEAQGENTLLLTVNSKGCGGNGYEMGFIERSEIDPNLDDVIVLDEATDRVFVVDGRAIPLLFGTQVDWVEDSFSGRFDFTNPNAAGSCGCGESFHTERSCG